MKYKTRRYIGTIFGGVFGFFILSELFIWIYDFVVQQQLGITTGHGPLVQFPILGIAIFIGSFAMWKLIGKGGK